MNSFGNRQEVGLSQTSDNLGPATHIEYLDAVRGWAILAVICVHVQACVGTFPGQQIFASGNYGVQLFFVLSALTICMSSYVRYAREPWSVISYFTRRACRILPLWWFAIVLHSSANLMNSGENLFHIRNMLTTATFLNAWNPMEAQQVVMGGWSIAVEITVYFLLPFVFCYCKSVTHAFCVMLGAVAFTKIGSCIELIQRSGIQVPAVIQEIIGPFSIFANAPAFAMGILLFFLFRDEAFKPMLSFMRKSSVLFIFLSGLVILPYWRIRYVPTVFIYSVLFASLICHLRFKPNRIFVNRFTVYLGKISYSCYVVHFVVLMGFGNLAGRSGISLLGINSGVNAASFMVLFIGTLCMTMFISSFTYKYIELPGMNLGRRINKQIAIHGMTSQLIKACK